MQKIIYIKNYKSHKAGDIEVVENNIAHGLIELGVAKLWTGEKPKKKIFVAPEDKMMRAETKKIKKTKGRYKIK